MDLTATRPDLERTITAPDSREMSQISTQQVEEIGQVAQRFIPLKISNCSWDCTRDAIITVCTGVLSLITGIGAVESSNDKETAAYATASTILGIFTVGMIVYGVTIRHCPASQRFWFRY